MLFATLILPITIMASFVAGSPALVERGTGLTAVPISHVPVLGDSIPAEGTIHPTRDVAKPRFEGGITGAPMSKRDDYNPLTKRALPLIYFYSTTGCTGSYYPYSLPTTPGNCYQTILFYSLWLENNDQPLSYGVYVGPSCDGEFDFLYSVMCY